jgi:hypothetical protein
MTMRNMAVAGLSIASGELIDDCAVSWISPERRAFGTFLPTVARLDEGVLRLGCVAFVRDDRCGPPAIIRLSDFADLARGS